MQNLHISGKNLKTIYLFSGFYLIKILFKSVCDQKE